MTEYDPSRIANHTRQAVKAAARFELICAKIANEFDLARKAGLREETIQHDMFKMLSRGEVASALNIVDTLKKMERI